MPPYHQKIVDAFYATAEKKGWRRHGDNIYEEVLDRGYPTNAFRLLTTIEQYFYALHAEGAHSSLACGLAMQQVQDAPNDERFPVLVRSQTCWSFENGIYCGEQDRFWRYDNEATFEDPESPFARNVASARYIDAHFPEDELMMTTFVNAPERIEASSFDKIFEAQHFDEDQIYWTWVFLGRLFYPVRSKDNWQVLLYLKGRAGTGNDAILRGIANAYEPADVGILGGGGGADAGKSEEKKIEKGAVEGCGKPAMPLSTLCDKFLVAAPNSADGLDAATMQAMVAGDSFVTKDVSGRSRVLAKWSAQLVLASNTFPSDIDSTWRRMTILDFSHAITDDHRASDEWSMLGDLPRIIVKANRHYLHAVRRYNNGEDVWSIVAPGFRKAWRHLAKN